MVRTVGITLAVGMVVWAFRFSAGLFRLLASPAYHDALLLARSSPEVQASLGSGITTQWTSGFAVKRYGSDFAVWSVRLAGSHGKGHLYGVANSINGNWEFARLTFVGDGNPSKTIDLAPAPSRLSLLPPVPSKKVYLVPLGVGSPPLDWTRAYYQAKFGIDVSLLPPAPLVQGLEDRDRRQLDATACLDYLRRLYPALSTDPSAILVGLTSQDIFIRTYRWPYAENYRSEGRFAIISSARLRPFTLIGQNPEWLNARFQKLLSKNIAVLYFDLPLSADYTSLLSGGVLSGDEIDAMTGDLVGVERHWTSFVDSPEISIYDLKGRPPLWRATSARQPLPDTSSYLFNADLTTGLFVLRKVDFHLAGEHSVSFVRAYRNQDERSRPFGIGTGDSLDIFLVGEMGVRVDLILDDGGRVRFDHAVPAPSRSGDTYVASEQGFGDFTTAVYAGDTWTVTRKDGWKFCFPYRPNAFGQNVTVLTGFTDPDGNAYRMERDSSGDLLSMTTPDSKWLHFEHDSDHRIRHIEASTGRSVRYTYDAQGRLSRVLDSEGAQEDYTYDDRAQMISVARGPSGPILVNQYDLNGHLMAQTMADGGKFEYHYRADAGDRGDAWVPDLITYPTGLVTYIHSDWDGYRLSLPSVPPYKTSR